MKTTSISLVALLAAAGSALAFPYTARPLPAGFNAAFFTGGLSRPYTQQPMAADGFADLAMLQQYEYRNENGNI